ncbi:GEgh16 protein [Pochonia chlamydosporia 170]|uniref:GEgh16 protein n=1 Tax=Pochonia chlamydosporia 170 TaxID=1380566 RepID=A0A179EXF2_METCM|nr:GEgh16 protein [Pochonia chlamydosporia 170]OAQ57533.1 GEgh16 protein [Pochonia chlamydosporia 170]
MRFTSSLLVVSYLFTLGNCHSVILNAQGISNSPASVGFQVDPAIARNCININPCQQDATIIRDAEIKANLVNKCGRTQLKGNIDVGENTENAIAAKAVTQVKKGSDITVTLHQVNADGAGPYICDVDETGNSGTFTNLTVANNVPGSNGLSQTRATAFNITVKMPDQLKCTGGSTGNVCVVRCRNTSVAGPFGGCFPVEQVDTEKTINSPASIKTKVSLVEMANEVEANQAAFKDAVRANERAGSDVSKQNLAIVNALLNETVVTKSFAEETPTVVVGGGEAPAVTSIQPAKGRNGNCNNNRNKNSNSNGNGNGNGNRNGNGTRRNNETQNA